MPMKVITMASAVSERDMIEVQVRLYATLRRFHPEQKLGEGINARVPAGTNIGELIAAIGLPPDTVRQVFSRGRSVEEDHILEDGEDVALFPPVAGGEPNGCLASRRRVVARSAHHSGSGLRGNRFLR